MLNKVCNNDVLGIFAVFSETLHHEYMHEIVSLHNCYIIITDIHIYIYICIYIYNNYYYDYMTEIKPYITVRGNIGLPVC